MKKIFVTNESASLFLDSNLISEQDLANKDVSRNVVFPELNVGDIRLPLTPQEIIDDFPSLWANGGNIFTTSEWVILCLMQQVRHGMIKPDDFELIHVGTYDKTIYNDDGSIIDHKIIGCRKIIKIDSKGAFEEDFPGGFFPERLELLM